MPNQKLIEDAFEKRAEFNPKNAPADVKSAVNDVLDQLDAGKLRGGKNQR